MIGRNDRPTPSEESEKKLRALDESIARGIADAEAGRVKSLDEVFDRLETKYRGLAGSKNR